MKNLNLNGYATSVAAISLRSPAATSRHRGGALSIDKLAFGAVTDSAPPGILLV